MRLVSKFFSVPSNRESRRYLLRCSLSLPCASLSPQIYRTWHRPFPRNTQASTATINDSRGSPLYPSELYARTGQSSLVPQHACGLSREHFRQDFILCKAILCVKLCNRIEPTILLLYASVHKRRLYYEAHFLCSALLSVDSRGMRTNIHWCVFLPLYAFIARMPHFFSVVSARYREHSEIIPAMKFPCSAIHRCLRKRESRSPRYLVDQLG